MWEQFVKAGLGPQRVLHLHTAVFFGSLPIAHNVPRNRKKFRARLNFLYAHHELPTVSKVILVRKQRLSNSGRAVLKKVSNGFHFARAVSPVKIVNIVRFEGVPVYPEKLM